MVYLELSAFMKGIVLHVPILCDVGQCSEEVREHGSLAEMDSLSTVAHDDTVKVLCHTRYRFRSLGTTRA